MISVACTSTVDCTTKNDLCKIKSQFLLKHSKIEKCLKYYSMYCIQYKFVYDESNPFVRIHSAAQTV